MPVAQLMAVRYDDTFVHGRSRPMLIAAAAADGTQDEVVLKLWEPARLDKNALVAELVASRLARELGLDAPEPFIVDVTPDFAASVPDAEARQRLGAVPGRHFASPIGFGPVSSPAEQCEFAACGHRYRGGGAGFRFSDWQRRPPSGESELFGQGRPRGGDRS